MEFSWLNNSFQKTKMNQSGRSITEMLGILILIGILSMGALNGYSWAIDKYRSNTLSRELLQRAVDIKNQLDRRKRDINLTKFKNRSLIGYPIGLAPSTPTTNEDGKTTVGIQVDNVVKRVCQMTFDNNIGLFDIDVNNVSYEKKDTNASDVCQNETINTMIFYIDDSWENNAIQPEAETTSPACPEINRCRIDDDCFHGEMCIMGCCVENTEVLYTSNTILMSDIVSTNVTSDVIKTDIVMTEPETTHVCPSGQKLYCAQDEAVAYQCTTISLASGTTQKICIWGTKCIEWACTSAELMQDPTTNLLDTDNTSPSRDREIPMTGEKEGKYPYCALEILERCALVSYCDDEPMNIPNTKWQQKCPSCFPGYYGEDFYDPYTQVCLGSELVEIDTKTDGVDILKQFSRDSSDNPISGTNGGAISSKPKEVLECVPELPCPDGGVPMRNGGCCTTGNAWYDCGTCEANPLYIDNCGNAYPMAHTCCDNSSNAPNGCSGVGNPFDEENPQPGNCYKNYPSKQGQCCDLACPNADGVPVCCSESNVVDLGSDGQICCQPGDDHPACVGMTTLPLETSTPETITPYGTETTSPEGSETTSPEGSETTSPEGSETTSPEGSETTSPEGSETTSPQGSETTTPETTTPETTTLDPRVNHECYNYCKRR
ncbi:MAG: hypothetical protein IKV03_04240 [Alphaproteobacteria bacterium]|nr:hypothetical protein [Alphaproteobacteria bacterium]